jgi:uncharacterized RDD family membrane protein YckC
MSVAQVRLVSGEAVDLDIRLARAGSRALALTIDIVIQLFLLYALSVPTTMLVALWPYSDAALFNAALIILVVLIIVGYPAISHAALRGRSVGKLALGLRVLRVDGGPITWRQSFTRAVVGAAVEWPGFVPGFTWLISLGILVSSEKAQRLADLAAGTIVIHERSPESWGWVPATPFALQGWAATLDLTNVDDRLALATRHFLSRSRSFTEPERTRLGAALEKELLAQTTPAPPPGTPGWAFLAAVVGERHRRAVARLARNRATQAKLWPELFTPAAPAPWRAAAQTAPPAAAIPGNPGQLRPAAPR